MAKFKDITGQRFGRLEVKRLSHRDYNKQAVWDCECDCGQEVKILLQSLTSGRTRSCGCLGKEVTSQIMKGNTFAKKHGGTGSRTYSSWAAMRSRCLVKSSGNYHKYGAKGVTICDRWKESFENFLEDMGKRPEGTSLDRTDCSKGYSPDNCRWATIEEQNQNRSPWKWKPTRANYNLKQ